MARFAIAEVWWIRMIIIDDDWFCALGFLRAITLLSPANTRDSVKQNSLLPHALKRKAIRRQKALYRWNQFLGCFTDCGSEEKFSPPQK